MITIIAREQFSVKESVWLGAALLSIEVQNTSKQFGFNKFFFTQQEILEIAQKLASGNVQNARISQHYNGDHPGSTQNFLREGPSKGRRLSHPLEFSDKVQPEFTNRDFNEIIASIYGEYFTLQGILNWYDQRYKLAFNPQEIIKVESESIGNSPRVKKARSIIKTVYNREEYLSNKFNEFLNKNFGLPVDDYYSKLSVEDYLGLKNVLSNINNILTLKVTLEFANRLKDIFSFNEEELEEIKNKILSSNPNANGYDIELSGPENLIAEVKCNVPVGGGNRYGAAQVNGIIKDYDGLIIGKSKSSIKPFGSWKFMVFPDLPIVREANRALIQNSKYGEQVIFLESKSELESKEKIYVCHVGIMK